MVEQKIELFSNFDFLLAISNERVLDVIETHLVENGANNIDHAECQTETISKMSDNHYDIIICSYSLKNSIDGQQIYEELNHLGLLHYNQIFIMLINMELQYIPHRSIEFEPDGYVNINLKDVNAILTQKLLNAIKDKQLLSDLYVEIEKRHYAEAIKLCEKKMNQYRGSTLIHLIRIKGKLLSISGYYQEAIEFYEYVLSKKQEAWALLELGKVNFILGNFDLAEKNFRRVIAVNKHCLEAYEWIYKIKMEQKLFEEAQEILMLSTKVFPHSITIQQMLYDISTKNGDFATARLALKESAALGRFSYLRRYTDFIKYSSYYFENCSTTNVSSYLMALKNALIVLEELPHLYENDDAIKVNVYHHLATMLETGGHHFEQATTQLIENNSELMNSLITQQKTNLKKIPSDTLPDDEFIPIEYREAHNEALDYYAKQFYQKAADIFDDLIVTVPENINIKLNAAITYLKLANIKSNIDYLKKADRCFYGVIVDEDNVYFPRYNEILQLLRTTKGKLITKDAKEG